MPKLVLNPDDLETIQSALMRVVDDGEPKEIAAVSRLLLSFGYLEKQPQPIPENLTIEFILRKVQDDGSETVTKTTSKSPYPANFGQEDEE